MPVIARVNDFLTPAALGALAVLGFAPFGWYPLTLLSLVGALALWRGVPALRAGWRGWVFGLGYFAAGVYWVFVSTHQFGGAPFYVSAFLVTLLVTAMALFPALVGLFAGATRKLPLAVWSLLFVPAAWILAELVRSRFGTGFPWLSLGYALTDSPLTVLAPIGGVYALSGVLMAGAGALALLFAGGLVDRLVAVALGVALPLAIWSLPPVTSWTAPVGDPLSVAIVQGNIPQDKKWDPAMLEPTVNRYDELTAKTEARLVIWPEAAIPALVRQGGGFVEETDAYIAGRGQTLLAGLLMQNEPGGPLYNSVLAMGLDDGRYFKRHLVPFGEYFPVPDFMLPLMDGVNLRYASLTHGPEVQPPIRVRDLGVGVSICYEDVFAYEIRKALPTANVLVNVTNDAWFADTTAPHQHLEIARMRAIETGRPLLRAANNGISAVIGADGGIHASAAQYVTEIVRAEVRGREGVTPFTRFGSLPLWALSVSLCAVGLLAARVRGL